MFRNKFEMEIFFFTLCMWIRRILFTLGMPLIILCGIVMFSDEEVKITAPVIVLNILLILITLWNLVFYFLSHCETRALLTLGLIIQIIIAILLIVFGANIHAMSSFLSVFAFLMYFGVDGIKYLVNGVKSILFKIIVPMAVLCVIAACILEFFSK